MAVPIIVCIKWMAVPIIVCIKWMAVPITLKTFPLKAVLVFYYL